MFMWLISRCQQEEVNVSCVVFQQHSLRAYIYPGTKQERDLGKRLKIVSTITVNEIYSNTVCT